MRDPTNSAVEAEEYIVIGEPVLYTRRFKFWGENWPSLLGILVFLVVLLPGVATLTMFFQASPPLGRSSILNDLVVLVLLFGFTVVWGLVVIVCSVLLLPMLYRNPTIESWSQALRAQCGEEGAPAFVVEVALRPKAVGGLEGFQAGCDDVGLLILRPRHLCFEGDSIHVKIRWSRADTLKVQKTGWRGVWLWGNDFHIEFHAPLDTRTGVVLRIREGWTMFHTRRRSHELHELLNTFLVMSQAM
jgi:hypothetical protein